MLVLKQAILLTISHAISFIASNFGSQKQYLFYDSFTTVNFGYNFVITATNFDSRK